MICCKNMSKMFCGPKWILNPESHEIWSLVCPKYPFHFRIPMHGSDIVTLVQNFKTKGQLWRGFDVFMYVNLNKPSNKQSNYRGFETPWCSLRHHCNAPSRRKWPTLQRWLQIYWHQIGARPSATTMRSSKRILPPITLRRYHSTVINQIIVVRSGFITCCFVCDHAVWMVPSVVTATSHDHSGVTGITMFIQLIAQANSTENIKAPHYWSLFRHRNPLTRGQ